MAKSARKMKGTISEDDIVSILHRYNATTICTLLQEVASWSVNVKIDWKTLVKRSCTGISNPREYQLLWHHLAYREPLFESIDGAEPTDDDSDLEFELEAVPAVSAEVSLEAATMVKVLMPPDLRRGCEQTNDSALGATKVIKTVNDPISAKAHGSHPFSEMNTTTISSHKRPLALGTIAERFEGNDTEGVGLPNRKKRKIWSTEEDAELIAAVQKHGEGNWVAILKGDFKHDRTQKQLSQRYSFLKKQSVKSKPVGASKPVSTVHPEQLNATRIAVDRALSMPIARSSSTIRTGPTKLATNLHLQTLNQAVVPSLRPQTSAKTSAAFNKPPRGHCSLISITAAAINAGGRVAAPSTAAYLMKAAQIQSKNVTHIVSPGSKMTLTPTTNRYSRPSTMPPLCTNSTLKATKLAGHQAQSISGGSDGQGSGIGAQPSPSLQENAEKTAQGSGIGAQPSPRLQENAEKTTQGSGTGAQPSSSLQENSEKTTQGCGIGAQPSSSLQENSEKTTQGSGIGAQPSPSSQENTDKTTGDETSVTETKDAESTENCR